LPENRGAYQVEPHSMYSVPETLTSRQSAGRELTIGRGQRDSEHAGREQDRGQSS